jgi:type I restriction-modification system DNA methylase subunit
VADIEIFKEKLHTLISKFEKDKHHYLSKGYLEAQLRIDFLNPFFEALGWDIENKAHKPPHDRDVIVELSAEATGRPDYNFRINGSTKFFVEAKAPSVALDDVNHILQAKTYAWSTKEVYFVILTDFEEFKLFDASLKPNSRYPNEGLIFDFKYTDYLKNTDKLYQLSKEEVEKGSLEKLLPRDVKSKRLRIPVDKAFLEDMTAWREELAKDIYKRNPEIDVKVLNEVVQKLLDRIVFIRIAEDRKIRDANELKEIVEVWRHEGKRKPILNHLRDLFYEVNDDLNGDIFKPHACESIDADSNLLADIIENLYFPKCRYRFDVIGVELLGSIYERYLGSTIRVTPQRIKVEEKPEVRKAGGVYYTPKYIVDYIVKNTVGKLIEGKTPKQIEKIKILDPACGSGSFLLGAYQYLLDYHLKYYCEHPKEAQHLKSLPLLYYKQLPEDITLPLHEKAKILRNNIFGVDIDPQAVEITMMSLYLKALEGERGLLPKKQHLLPSLSNNIKCGNSLIGYDIFDTPQSTLPLSITPSLRQPRKDSFIPSPLVGEGKGEGEFSDETRSRINPFDWNSKTAGFGEIMHPSQSPLSKGGSEGGFDVVIGNPPYGAWFTDEEASYFEKKFKVFSGVKDVYALFIENGISLLKQHGYISFIVPSAWIGGPNYLKLRQIILENQIDKIVMLPFDVFESAYIDTLVFAISKGHPKSTHAVKTFIYPKKERLNDIQLSPAAYFKVNQKQWTGSDDKKIILNPSSLNLIEKLSKNIKSRFADQIRIKRGVLFDKKLLTSEKKNNQCFRYFEGDIYRYSTNEVLDNWIEFGPALKERPKEFDWFEGKRILLRRLVNRQQRLMASLADNTYITNKNLYSIKAIGKNMSIEIILGILNSKLISYLYLQQVSQATKDDFPQVTITDIMSLPFPNISVDNEKVKALHQAICRMLVLHKKKNSLPPSAEREKIEREIAVTDEKIDGIVYGLYGVTEEERKIIEGR